MRTIHIEYHCSDCYSYNKQNIGTDNFEERETKTESLSDAVKNHILKDHYVSTVVYETGEDDCA